MTTATANVDEKRRSKLSPAKLALLEKRLRGEMESVKRIEPDPEHLHDPFPLTEMCEAQWMGRSEAYELGGVSAHAYAELFDSECDLERLEKAWNALIDHYEMFRAIVRTDGQYEILEEVPYYEIEVKDLRGKSEEEKTEYLEFIKDKMRRDVHPGDRWPLFEIKATIIEDGKIRLHLSLDLLIADIGSLQRIGRQLTLLYENPDYELGEPPELTFRDYNVAVTAFRKHPLYERSKEYWLSRLDDLPPAPDMPVMKNPEKLEYPYFTHDTRVIDPETWQRFQDRARKHGMTPDVTMNAVYADIIAMWTKRAHFTLNVLSFKRLPIHKDVHRLSGNFGSTILLAVENWGGESFVSRAKRLHQQLLRDLDHWFFSGVTMLRELNRHKGGSRGAGMPVVFASTLNYSTSQTLLEAENFWKKYMIQLYLQTPQVWLDHQIAEEDGALELEWDRVEELFPENMTTDMLDAYEALVRYLADSDEPWTSPRRDHILPPAHLAAHEALNKTEGAVPEGLLHTLFTEKAAQSPDHPAVITAGRKLSYGELDKISNQVAHWLRGAGAEPNQLVGVVMEKGWEQVAAALGVLKSGAAYLPIDPDTPPARLEYLLENGDVKLVLTQSSRDSSFEWPAGIDRLSLDDDKALAALSDSALESVQKQDDIAYVIYTSGSTGQPKGVVIDHRGAVNTICDVNERFGVGPEDRVLALSALTFDLSVYDVFGALAAGATIVMPKAVSNPDPAYWAELVKKEGVTLWNSVPALMELVVSHLEESKGGKDHLGSLRLLLMSGDWIPVGLPDRVRALSKDLEIISLGGATEASIWSILYPIGEVDPAWQSIPYGKPMKNQRFYVLNEYMEPKPFWVPGDLYIGGVGLAKGYWRDDEKTAASFVTHPETGERLYKTGDLGCLRPDGNIEFLGREDLQVKVRGFRIELGEIEAILNAHPSVSTAIVAAMGADSETRRLIAYLQLEEGAELDTDELPEMLTEKLPEYMIPARFVKVDELPLTSNGKVDRRALSDPETLNRWQQSRVYIEPSTATEKELAEIWQSLLDIDQVGAGDNFFELGGTSLLVNQLVARIYDEMDVELPMRLIFEQPLISEMARALDELRENPETDTTDAMTADDLAAEAMLDDSIGA